MNNLARNVIIWLIFGAALIGLFNLFQSPSSGQPANELAYSDFVAEVEAQQIDEVLIDGRTLRGESKNGRVITSVMPEGTDIVAVLDKNDVRIVASPDNSGMPSFFSILVIMVSHVAVYRHLDFLHAPDARGITRCHGVWQIAGKIINRTSRPGHI